MYCICYVCEPLLVHESAIQCARTETIASRLVFDPDPGPDTRRPYGERKARCAFQSDGRALVGGVEKRPQTSQFRLAAYYRREPLLARE